MITAAISAAITAVLSFFGMTPSGKQLVAIVIAVKICVVIAIALIGSRFAKHKASKHEAPGDPPDSA